jgi:ureidoglycolate lyase
MPVRIDLLERHPNSSQCFFSISADRFLVVTAPRACDGALDPGGAEAFVGQRGQGVAYQPDVWHAPIVALDRDGDFLMLIWEQNGPEDCRVERLAAPLHVSTDRA